MSNPSDVINAMSNPPDIKMNAGTGCVSMMFHLANHPENQVYENGCYILNFESAEEMFEYQESYTEVKWKIADIAAARNTHRNQTRYEQDIRSIYVPMARSFVSKYGELALPDVCFSLRSCEFALGMELTPWVGYETKWAEYSANMDPASM